MMLMLVLLGAAGPERRGVEASAVLKVATLSLGSQRHCCTVNVGLPAVQKHETVRCPPAMRCQRQNIRTVAHHPEAPSGSSNTGTAVCQSCANTPLTFTNRASGTASTALRCAPHLLGTNGGAIVERKETEECLLRQVTLVLTLVSRTAAGTSNKTNQCVRLSLTLCNLTALCACHLPSSRGFDTIRRIGKIPRNSNQNLKPLNGACPEATRRTYRSRCFCGCEKHSP